MYTRKETVSKKVWPVDKLTLISNVAGVANIAAAAVVNVDAVVDVSDVARGRSNKRNVGSKSTTPHSVSVRPSLSSSSAKIRCC